MGDINIFWLWLAAGVIFLIVELMTPTLFFICFVIGAIVSAIYSNFYPESYYWQIGIFLIVSLLLLPPARMVARKHIKKSETKSNVDALIGKVGKVTKTIDSDDGGQVQIAGEIWIAAAEKNIENGSRVKVVSVSGARLHVEPAEEQV